MLDNNLIERIEAATDIVDVVGRYVDLKRQGKEMVGLCPFHGEKTPSFKVNGSKGFFHCFGCGMHGDAIEFLMEHVGVRFTEAVSMLAREAGIEVDKPHNALQGQGGRGKVGFRTSSEIPSLPKRASRIGPHPTRAMAAPEQALCAEELQSMESALEFAQEKFSGHLLGGAQEPSASVDAARRYLFEQRGLNESIVRRYGIGFSGDARDWFLRQLPQESRLGAARAGLLTVYGKEDGQAIEPTECDAKNLQEARSLADRFRGRITFPIRDDQGKIRGFGARSIPPEREGSPKYINTQATALFSKGALLYGLHEATPAMVRSGCVVVVEGYLDAISLAQFGIENVVASMGTAIQAGQIAQLFSRCARVVFCFDGDVAGKKAAVRAMRLCAPLVDETHSAGFLLLPGEDDPDSYVRRVGAEVFHQDIAQAKSLQDMAIDVLTEGLDLTREAGIDALKDRAQDLLDNMQQGAVRRGLAQRVSALVGNRVDGAVSKPAKKPAGRVQQQVRWSAREEGQEKQAEDDPAWIAHIRTAVRIVRNHGQPQLRDDLESLIIRLSGMLEEHTTQGAERQDSMPAWSQSVQSLLQTLGAGEASAGSGPGPSPAEMENLSGAMRQAELIVLGLASVRCIGREDLSEIEKARMVKSLHDRKAEIVRAMAPAQQKERDDRSMDHLRRIAQGVRLKVAQATTSDNKEPSLTK
jgi:DNA primase catalytic core